MIRALFEYLAWYRSMRRSGADRWFASYVARRFAIRAPKKARFRP